MHLLFVPFNGLIPVSCGLIVCLKLSYLIIPNLLSRLRGRVCYVAAAIVGFVRPVQSRSTITDNS